METIFRKREKALISLAYYISKLLGKSTIDKKSSGETRGRQGSSSRNYDVLGREIMMSDEVRKMDNKKCLVFIRGFDPVMDNKFIPSSHKMFAQTADGGGMPYQHNVQAEKDTEGQAFTILNSNSLKYYENLKEKGGEVYIDTLSYEDLQWLGQEKALWTLLPAGRQKQMVQYLHVYSICHLQKNRKTKLPLQWLQKCPKILYCHIFIQKPL